MRDINDLDNAFGQAGDGFQNNVYLTLAKLHKSEDRKPMRTLGLRLAAVIAAACTVFAATALALSNTWGIMDFLTNRQNNEVLPGASDIVQRDVPQTGGQSEMVAFSVREAVFDGKDIYIVVEAKPAEPEYLLLGSDSMPSYPISDLGPLFSSQTGTIRDYAAEHGKTVIRASIGMAGNCSIDFLLESDGTLVYLLNGRYDGDEVGVLNLEVTCAVSPFIAENGTDMIDESNIQIIPLTVALENTGTKDTVSSTAPAVYSDCGVRVDSVTLTGSPMAVYAVIEYTVIDEELFSETDSGLWFEFLDESGEQIPFSTGSIEELDGSGLRFVQNTSLQAAETMPHSIILRGYNAIEKNRYEAHTFDMRRRQ